MRRSEPCEAATEAKTRRLLLSMIASVSLGLACGDDNPAWYAAGSSGQAVWSVPVALNANAPADSGFDWTAQVTTDGAGNWVAVWRSDDTLGATIGSDSDILFARSTDNGQTWTAPAALNSTAATDSGFDEYPQLTTDGADHWVAVWEFVDPLGGTFGVDHDILVARSTDNGQTWTAPTALNSNAAADQGTDSFPQLTTDGAGTWVAVWYSSSSLGGTIGADYDILWARSTSNGQTWTAPAALNSNAAADAALDAEPQLTTDGAGRWLAVWRSDDSLGGTIGTDYDILFARSMNNGQTWTAAAPLNSDAAADTGSDQHPQLTTDGLGNWVAVWFSTDSVGGTDYQVLYARSTNNGQTWTAPAALDSDATESTGPYDNPQITTDGAGNWMAVWYTSSSLGGTIGADYDILWARSTDNGQTWTVPAALNSNAAVDSGYDVDPQITTDGAGQWVVVWHSRDSLGGTIGTDDDILVSRARF